MKRGPLPEAVALMERALEHHLAGRVDEAVEHYGRALEADPNFVQAHHNLGVALQALGRLDDAVVSFHKALAIKPDLAEAHVNLGIALNDLARLDEAVACYHKAISLKPEYAEAYNNLGGALHNQGKLEEATEAYRKAVDLNPSLTQTHTNLGIALQALGRMDEALASFHKALAINPDLAEAHANVGIVQAKLGRLDEAAASYRKAISLNPDVVDTHCNLGNVLLDMVELDEALECYRQGMAIGPNYPEPANNYLHALLYVPDLSNDDLFDNYRRIIGGRHPDPASTTASTAATKAPAPGDKLRIGYLSSDFYDHPLGDIVMPLLGNHDHRQFEIFCYAGVVTPDHVTSQFQDHADHWRPINGLSDPEIAGLIRDDGIHIMVYLGGHFDDNHPSLPIHRPAPVQVSMHAGTTSALDEINYWMTDGVLHPPPEQGDTTERFTEELFRLPAFYIYPKTVGAPPVSPPPAEANGFITFCSFNKPCKMNERVLDLWSEILRAAPDTRLMLKFKNHFESPSLKRKFLDRFDGNGVAVDRITLLTGHDSFLDHLANYAQADIALDPFPFNGATTTFQALWMGVPVISLLGNRFISRAGGSISTHAGLGDLVADTPQDYLEKAAALAGDLPRLKDLRATLRQRAEESPLCDGPGYAATVEKAFRDMWASYKPSG